MSTKTCKLTINNQLYINMDNIINVDKCPDITDMLVKSYDYINHNTYISTFDLDKNPIKDTWYALKNLNAEHHRTNKEIWETEIKHGVRSPYYILALREGGHRGYIYDSIDTPLEVWDSIKWKSELKDLWSPLINYIESLDLTKIGHCSIFVNRPGVIPWYHVDSGADDDIEKWKPKPHREEFIWINLNQDKKMYILDNNIPTPIESTSAFFNTHNYHGSHECTHGYSFSLRIECIFSETLRKKMLINNIQKYYYEKSSLHLEESVV